MSLAAAEKKFIELGWDIPDTAFLRAHYQQREQETPFDGVIFRVQTSIRSLRMNDGMFR